MTTILQALGLTLAYGVAGVFVLGMCAGCAATVLASRQLKGR